MQPTTCATINALYLDGQSAQAHAVRLHIENGHLRVAGNGFQLDVPLRDVQWPEPGVQGKRGAHFKQGGLVQSADTQAWDEWYANSGLRHPLVARLQQSGRWVAVSVLMLVGLVVAMQMWGLPLAARGVVALTPMRVDIAMGEATLRAIDASLMAPSQLTAATQAQVQSALAQALAQQTSGPVPAYTLVFRHSRIGPNALALPGGTLIMTDELVTLVDGDASILTAVLAHEMGHLRHRHGLRMLVQATVLGALGAIVLGDFSTLLAAMPALLGQAQYSREAEREADAHAVQVLKAAGISPAVMLTLFDKLEQHRRKDAKPAEGTKKSANWLGIAFASHPSDADRIDFFKAAAAAAINSR